MSGIRVVDDELLSLGMTMPGLARRAEALSELPPLGLLTIAATIDERWQVLLLSDDGRESFRDSVDRIMSSRPDVVAFSALTPAVTRAAEISQSLRKFGVSTLLGGLHATAAPETCIDYFDAVAVGDGERLLPRMLDDWRDCKLGGIYRENQPIELADSPMPRWDLLGDESPPLFWMWACLACAGWKLNRPERHYVVFLTGYWLTAPLAWIYGVPAEAYFDEITSLRYNLTALSIVSIWRVLLFSRIASIQFRIPFLISLSWILVPCMLVAFIGLLSKIVPLVPIMGGIRLTETQRLLLDYQQSVVVGLWWSFLPVLAFAVGCDVWLGRCKPSNLRARTFAKVSRGTWMVPATAIGVFAIGSCFFQPRLYRAAAVDRQLANGNIDTALETMASTARQGFPVDWDPPPHFPLGGPSRPRVLELVEAVERIDAPSWAVNLLFVQSDEILVAQHGWTQGTKKTIC